jgi:hypothetical protein
MEAGAWRPWADEANESGNSGKYFGVLNFASENRLYPAEPFDISPGKTRPDLSTSAPLATFYCTCKP